MSNSHTGLKKLLSFMEEHVGLNDFEKICFQLAINHEDIAGANRQAKVRELIQYMQRYGRLCDLLSALSQLFPHFVGDLNQIALLLDCPTVKFSSSSQETPTNNTDSQEQNASQTNEPVRQKERVREVNSNLQIVNRTGRPLNTTNHTLFQTLFTEHSRLIVRSEFGTGLSGSSVFLVRPVRTDGMVELPAVVKVDRTAAIQREWQAYRNCIERRLAGVAEIRDEPIFSSEGQWGGLWYPLAGDGTFDIQSFHEYYDEHQAEDVQHVLAAQLGRSLSKLWQQSQLEPDFHVGTFYDSFLPMNLVIDCRGKQSAVSATTLTPHNAPYNTLQTGDAVQLSGFRIARVFTEQSRLSLDIPADQHAAYRTAVYVDSVAGYEEGQILTETLTGVVTKMRHELLLEQAQKAMADEVDVTAVPLRTPKGQFLPNPLTTLPTILSQTFDTRLACLHGDLNLQNILVEPQSRTVRLIDFAKSGRNHVLRDLICLEMNIVTRLVSPALAEAMLTPEDIVGFYQKLHCAMRRPNTPIAPPVGLEKPFAVLHTLHQQARQYLFTADKWDEYYYGLFIYFLGALKFGDLDLLPAAPWPKQLAFYGAAAVQKLLDEGDKVCEETAVSATIPSTTQTPTRATTTRPTYTDSFSSYERGLQSLLDQLGPGHAAYSDALPLQQRLQENIQRARRYGDTAARRADRAEVIDELNSLALAQLNTTFNDLCQ